jgi:hypothetical protein
VFQNQHVSEQNRCEHIGINKSLLRQYAKGIKYPGLKQTMRIENALDKIKLNLLSSRIVAGAV